MTKKKRHKYKIGTEVKFKFFDGSVHVGSILKQTYQGDNWDHIDTDYKQPLYTIQVPDSRDTRGFMIYPGVGLHRILESNGITNKEYVYKKGAKIASSKTIKSKFNDTSTELNDAIRKQTEFISGKVKN